MVTLGRQVARRLVHAAGRSKLGQRLIDSILAERPELAVAVLRRRWRSEGGFTRVERWPDSVEGFEDLSFLFRSNELNMGTALLTLNEAAYLYRLVHGLGPGTVVEIGRFRGGSTFLMAAALHEGGELYSYDIDASVTGSYGELDAMTELRHALSRYGLDRRVRLLVADSKTAQPPPRPCELVFIDGDHSYEGVLADYEHWRAVVPIGGHLLFHDAAGPLGDGGVVTAVERIRREDSRWFEGGDGADSIVHFVRTAEPSDWSLYDARDSAYAGGARSGNGSR
jgi:predicted O-methyltransferase YrrM